MLLFLTNTSVLLVVLIGAWSLAVACVNVSVTPSSVGWIGVNVFNAVILYPYASVNVNAPLPVKTPVYVMRLSCGPSRLNVDTIAWPR